MDRLRWIGVSLEPEGECLRHRIEVRADVTSGLPTLFTSKDQFDLAAYLPERTSGCVQMALDGPAMTVAMRKLAAQYGPHGLTEFEQEMEQMREHVGTDVPELLSLIGNEIALAVVPPESGIFPDIYLIAKAKDGKSAARVRELLEGAVRARNAGAEVQESKYQDYRISYAKIADGPFFPSVMVDADRVVVGSNLSALKRYVQFLKAGAPALAAKKSYRESITSVATGPATGYLFVDWPSITSFVYGNFANIAPTLMQILPRALANDIEDSEDSEMDEPGAHPKNRAGGAKSRGNNPLRFDWAKLPTSDTITRYIPPQAMRVRISNQGLSVDSRAFF
jgi:hypothetical protein